MAPADTNNWLSFSLSSMEMLSNPPLYPQVQTPLLLDNFYANEWMNAKASEEMDPTRGFGNEAYLDMHHRQQQQTVPKLEDFLGGDTSSSLNTQDSSTLTHVYEQNGPYLNTQESGMAVGGFSGNSGSEVEDSASIGKQLACVEVDEHFGGSSGALSLAVVSKPVVGGKKLADTFGQRTSIYRGVTRHRWTGRYEAHLWDNSCRREGQARKGRQVYLGGYDKEDKAARSYDLAALKYWGPSATTNFPITNYSQEVDDMKNMTKQEFIASLRRKSSGFSRGASIYRGVTRHHQQGRWQARIGRVAGNKDLYLGTFATEEEAAEAYDIAAIKFRGVNAVTNFEMNRYDVEAILKSALPVGGAAKRLKVSAEQQQQPDEQKAVLSLEHHQHSSEQQQGGCSGSINFGSPFLQQQQQQQTLPYALPLDASSFYQQAYFHHYNGGSNMNGNGEAAIVSPISMVPPPAEFYLWPHPHTQQQPY